MLKSARILRRAAVVKRALIVMGTSTAAAVVSLGLAATPALAKTTNDVFGKLAGDLSNWAGEILAPTVGLMGLAALFRRDVGHAVTLAVIAIIVGIFAYAPGGADRMITTIVNGLT